MDDFILLVNCYLYGIIIIMLAVLLLLVYVRGQISHTFTSPFEHKDIKYQCSNLAKGSRHKAPNGIYRQYNRYNTPELKFISYKTRS